MVEPNPIDETSAASSTGPDVGAPNLIEAVAQAGSAGRTAEPPPTMLTGTLTALAVLSAGGGVLGAGLVLQLAQRDGAISAGALLSAGGVLLVGWTAGGICWACGWVVRNLDRQVRRTLRDAPAGGDRAGERYELEAVRRMEADLRTRIEELSRRLGEMQSDLLLSDDQRGAKRERLQAGRFQEWADQFHRSLAERSFEQADQCLARLDAELPGDPRTDTLRDELADARTDARADDLRQSREHVEGLMAVGRFDEAVRSAESAAGRHPDSDEAAELLARSRREAEAFNTERVRRLYDEVRRHAEARRWSDALAAARQLIDRHGQTGEAQLVSANLPTLEGNARLEEVRQLRDRIRDLLQRKRYRDALDLAREVIQRYPETAAAMELREQMGRLRELAMGG